MPFKVRFDIYEPGKQAPCFTTDDRALAYARFNDMKRRPELVLSRMTVDVTPVEPTRAEAYLFLVYQVRQLQREYFDHGRSNDVLKQALAKETELDNWNRRTHAYIDAHPMTYACLLSPGSSMPSPRDGGSGSPSVAFFQLVDAWRKTWREYFSYKKQEDHDQAVAREMKKKCTAYEKEIDNYIIKTIGL